MGAHYDGAGRDDGSLREGKVDSAFTGERGAFIDFCPPDHCANAAHEKESE